MINNEKHENEFDKRSMPHALPVLRHPSGDTMAYLWADRRTSPGARLVQTKLHASMQHAMPRPAESPRAQH